MPGGSRLPVAAVLTFCAVAQGLLVLHEQRRQRLDEVPLCSTNVSSHFLVQGMHMAGSILELCAVLLKRVHAVLNVRSWLRRQADFLQRAAKCFGSKITRSSTFLLRLDVLHFSLQGCLVDKALMCALQPVGHLPGRDWHGGVLCRPGPLLAPSDPGLPNPEAEMGPRCLGLFAVLASALLRHPVCLASPAINSPWCAEAAWVHAWASVLLLLHYRSAALGCICALYKDLQLLAARVRAWDSVGALADCVLWRRISQPRDHLLRPGRLPDGQPRPGGQARARLKAARR